MLAIIRPAIQSTSFSGISTLDKTDYKYDVAFSFLAQDEAIAVQLNDMLQDRLTTFLYSKRQETVAGTDGELRFGEVFGRDARLVIVLYRAGWGESPWTRIEETAIRNRAFDEGYDFVKFILLEDKPQVPRWLPRPQIWIGLSRWGLAGAASVIEARVQELGGTPREETVTDRAMRLARSLEYEKRRKRFLNSDEGVRAAHSAFDQLLASFENLIRDIQASAPGISLTLKHSRHHIVILGPGPALSIEWNARYSNSLDGACLEWREHPPFLGIMHVFDEPTRTVSERFQLDLSPDDSFCWKPATADAPPVPTGDLPTLILKRWLEQSEKHRK